MRHAFPLVLLGVAIAAQGCFSGGSKLGVKPDAIRGAVVVEKCIEPDTPMPNKPRAACTPVVIVNP